MFYSDLFSPDDKQNFLKLRDAHIIASHVPSFMDTSHNVMMARRVEMRGMTRLNAETNFIPCVKAQAPFKLIKEMLAGSYGRARESLAILFSLGLAVPEQRDIAQFIRQYTPEQDPDGAALRSIRKLVVSHQTRLEETQLSTGDMMYPARYLAKLLDFNSFVCAGKGETKHRVPAGIPVILVYYTSDFTQGDFKLVDAFDLTAGNVTPFAHIALRRDTQIPQQMLSPNLARAASYALVFGVLAGGTALRQFIDTVGYDDVEIAASSDTSILPPDIAAKVNNCKTEEERSRMLRKAARLIEKSGPLATAEFVAVDVGLIDRKGRIRSNSSTVQKTSNILRKIGFQVLAKNAPHDSVLTYSGARVWKIGG